MSTGGRQEAHRLPCSPGQGWECTNKPEKPWGRERCPVCRGKPTLWVWYENCSVRNTGWLGTRAAPLPQGSAALTASQRGPELSPSQRSSRSSRCLAPGYIYQAPTQPFGGSFQSRGPGGLPRGKNRDIPPCPWGRAHTATASSGECERGPWAPRSGTRDRIPT